MTKKPIKKVAAERATQEAPPRKAPEKAEKAAPEPSPESLAIGRRIHEMRMRKDWTQSELAERSGVTQQNVAAYENGKAENPKFLRKLAAPLGVSLDWLVYGVAEKERMMPLLGVAAAGRWIDPDLLDPPVMIPSVRNPHSQWGDVDQYAVRLEGPSMNKRIPDGSLVICSTFKALKMEPRTGHIVHAIIRRGDVEEWSVKKLVIGSDGGVELWPESTDERFQTPQRFDRRRKDESLTLEIRGLVITTLQNLHS